MVVSVESFLVSFEMEIIVVLALLTLCVGFLAGVLVGVVVTSWVMTRKSFEKPEEDRTPTEERFEKEVSGDRMEVDDARFGDDPPTDEEEGEVKPRPHTTKNP